MRQKTMNKKITLLFLLSISLAIAFTGCSGPLQQNQIQFGIKAAQKDLWNEAIFRWKKAIQFDPNSSAAHNNLAVAYEKKGLWEDAKKEYEIALKLSPKNKYIKSNYEKLKNNLEGNEEKDKDEKK